MTNYMNYIKNIINTETEMDKDSIEKLVKIAYYMGREEAAREVSDKYSDHIAEQKQRASECRYHNMAAEIVGDPPTDPPLKTMDVHSFRPNKHRYCIIFALGGRW